MVFSPTFAPLVSAVFSPGLLIFVPVVAGAAYNGANSCGPAQSGVIRIVWFAAGAIAGGGDSVAWEPDAGPSARTSKSAHSPATFVASARSGRCGVRNG